MSLKIFIGTCIVLAILSTVASDQYDDNIEFEVTSAESSSFVWIKGTNLSSQSCSNSGKITILVHGYLGARAYYIDRMIAKFTQYRGGCVIFMNWGFYSDNLNYFRIKYSYFGGVSSALLRRLQDLESEGFHADNMFLYGHSLGARLVLEVGINFGGRISRIDACDPAGPGFGSEDYNSKYKLAAKNVQCIHTSIVLGTPEQSSCHQDWLMGYCGVHQPAAHTLSYVICEALDFIGVCTLNPDRLSSHHLCNEFYIQAFENDFVANNEYSCKDVLPSSSLPPNFKMGYMESRRNSSIVGKIACPTTSTAPYVATDQQLSVTEKAFAWLSKASIAVFQFGINVARYFGAYKN